MVKKKLIEAVTSNDPQTRRWRMIMSSARMSYEAADFRQAESLLARASELARELPESKFALLSTEVGRAAVLIAKRRPAEAQEFLQPAMRALRSESESIYRELLAVAMRFDAQILADTGKEHEAEQQLLESKCILEELGPDASVQLAYTLADLSGLYIVQARFSEAESLVLRVMKILSTVLGTDNSEYVRADMIYQLCRPMEPEARLNMVPDDIQKMQYFFGQSHPQIGRALDRYFNVLKNRGDQSKIDEAMAKFGLVSRQH